MKNKLLKLFSFLILAFMVSFSFYGCSEDYTIDDVSNLYIKMKSSVADGEINNIFSNKEKPFTIFLQYPANVQDIIEKNKSNNNIEKRYMALGYQQKILNNIYNIYEDTNADFYRILSTTKVNQNEINSIYSNLDNLSKELINFKNEFDLFILNTNSGISDVSKGKINLYTYHTNRLIEKSFSFIGEYVKCYEKYCFTPEDKNGLRYWKFLIDKANVDIANIVFLENIKSFDCKIGTNGVCDLSSIIENDLKFNIVSKLKNYNFSNAIYETIKSQTGNVEQVTNYLNEFKYSYDIFNQSYLTYINIYNNINFNEYNSYRFNLGNGITYENYLNSLKISEQSDIKMLEEFIVNKFNSLILKIEE